MVYRDAFGFYSSKLFKHYRLEITEPWERNIPFGFFFFLNLIIYLKEAKQDQSRIQSTLFKIALLFGWPETWHLLESSQPQSTDGIPLKTTFIFEESALKQFQNSTSPTWSAVLFQTD